MVRKHVVHGVLFLLAGLFVLGNAVSMGVFSGEVTSRSWGVTIAVALLGMGLFLLVSGRKFLEEHGIVAEYYEAIAMAVGIAFMVRTFMIEPFKIPSGSMIPTLLVGDYLFVNKVAYGYRVPFTRDRILMGEGPKRGEIAVFEYPRDPAKDYIKRIIGLPGDRVVYRDKRLYVNGKLVANRDEGPYPYYNEEEQLVESRRFSEQLGEGAHSILLRAFINTDQVTDEVIPPGHYFVMGDNRDNSNDSRFWGLVPEFRLVGRAVGLFWSWDRMAERLRWERLGQGIR